MLKKVLSAILVVAMLATLVSCAGNNNASSTAPAESSEAAPAESSEAAPAESSEAAPEESAEAAPAESTEEETATAAPAEFEDKNGNGFTDLGEHPGLMPYEEVVPLSVGLYEGSAIDWKDGDDYTENVWTRGALEHLNIDIDVQWVVSKKDYDTKLNLMIASDDLPDFFNTEKMSVIKELMGSEMIQDLGPSYDALATPELHSIFETEASAIACHESGIFDGKMYALSQGSGGYTDKPHYLWISQKWMDQVGASFPTSMQELKDLALKFMDAGLCDYGIAASSDLEPILEGLALGFHAYPRSWLRADDGSVVYGGIQPEVKEFLKEMHDWYELGIFKDDFTSRDTEQMYADMAALDCGIGCLIHAYGYWVGQDLVESIGKEELAWPCEIPSVDAEPVNQVFKWPNLAYVCCSSKCANPDAVVKMFNYYWCCTRNPDASFQPFREGGADDVFLCIRLAEPTGESAMYYACKEAIETGDESVLKEVYWQNKYANIQSFESADFSAMGDVVGDRMQAGPNGAYSVGCPIVENGKYIVDVLSTDFPQIYLDRGDTLQDIMTEGFTQIIVGEKEIDYFDELCQYWLESGGQEFTDEMNVLYAE